MDIKNLADSSVVICDDSITSVTILSKLLQNEGIANVKAFTDPRQVVPYLMANSNAVDLLILDIEMPHINGMQIMAAIDEAYGNKRAFSILVITGLQNRDVRRRALTAGANDFIDKPFDQMEVVLRVQNLLRVQRALKAQTLLARELEIKVKQRTQELAAMNEALEEKVALRTLELLRAEKMASVGRLAAGIAHEINNPLGFVQSNLACLKDYAADLFKLIDDLSVVGLSPAEIASKLKQVEVDYVKDDLFGLINESRDGLRRVATIVQKLKDFSHVDREVVQELDVNIGIENSLQMAWSEIEQRDIEVVREFGNIPWVHCIPAQINVVFFNIILNAVQAMEPKGRLEIKTQSDEKWVHIVISDTGRGISDDVIQNIFDPFYTTRQIGNGMGLGLPEAYNIVSRHGGTIDVKSVVGKGSTFNIRLPIANQDLKL